MERMTRMLREIGISQKEMEVYLFLSKKGTYKAGGISKALNIDRVQLYRLLKDLQKRGMIESTFEYPASYVAVDLEKVLDMLINVKKQEAANLERKKANMLSTLKTFQFDHNGVVSDKFMVLEGKYLNSKILQMVQQVKERLDVVTTGQGVIQSYRSGLLEYGFQKRNVYFRFLTNLSTIADNLAVTKQLLVRAEEASVSFDSHIGDIGAGYFPRFLIKDGIEMLIYLRNDLDLTSATLEDTGLFTNNRVLVRGFTTFFELMWRNSEDIKDALKRYEKIR